MRQIQRWVGWIGDYQAITTIIQSEFLRIYVWPSAAAVMTGGAGVFGQIPVMWVLMASAVSFAAIAHGALRLSEYHQRKTPLNKIKFVGTHAAFELRQSEGVGRTIQIGQIQVELINDASFPISVVLNSAETEIEGHTPPRFRYPREPMLYVPGQPYRMADLPIALNGRPCGNLDGKMHFDIRYGLPGNEVHSLKLKGNVMVAMNQEGIVSVVATDWAPYQP